ncbi:hypothetical protein O6P32_06965 [Phocaeicola sp. KGMB11183]|uniref:Glycosyltransferase family 1 protein n=1 Tax=Phocaeicola acetigenes TaxID=3016083 RepID=A0ABT4PHC6_9BACT|nr:hypothetical protein [Phocaeicola sp. KGMB11183]MCZ8372451.1 hypothetical protein [Phocaeicola sp. KGMB11183]
MKTLYIADVRSMNNNGISPGHYFPVASNYYNMFKDTCKVLVTGGPIYKTKFNNTYLLPYDTYSQKSNIINKIRTLKNLMFLFKHKNENDIIIIQSSSVATALIGIALFKQSKCKVYTIQYNTECVNSPIKKIIYKLASSKINGIICPDKKIGNAYKRPYCIVPDYIYTGHNAKKILPFSERKYDFSLLGLICKDKGVVEVAQKLKHTNYRILIAGKPQTEEIKKEIIEICKNSNNIELKLEYLSDEEYDTTIRNSKYCILNYSGAYSEHSSGVVFDIIFRGTPVIGKKCKFLDFITVYNIGRIFDEIENFSPTEVLIPSVHQNYINNINNYYLTHQQHILSLKNFLNL